MVHKVGPVRVGTAERAACRCGNVLAAPAFALRHAHILERFNRTPMATLAPTLPPRWAGRHRRPSAAVLNIEERRRGASAMRRSEAKAGGVGGNILAQSLLKHPPPLTPPRHALRARGEGNREMCACLSA